MCIIFILRNRMIWYRYFVIFPCQSHVKIHELIIFNGYVALNWMDVASLVVQWLRIRLPMQGTWVRALVWEDPTCCGATQPMRHNYWACALQPVSHNYWACLPQLLKPTCLEPSHRNKRSHRSEKPAHHNKEWPPLATTRESLHAAMKTKCSQK